MMCRLHTSGEKDIRTYVQKKREVFLVHMACDNKREEAVAWSCFLVGVARNHPNYDDDLVLKEPW